MSRVAYLKPCRGCGAEIFMALCRDGRWRPFQTELRPTSPTNVWAWRKHHGMEETDIAPGYGIHYCADFHDHIDPAVVLRDLAHLARQESA